MLRVNALIIFVLAVIFAGPIHAESSNDSVEVLQAFNTNKEESAVVQIENKTKQKIMFYMSVPLLLLLITTVILGISMAVWGKQVFVAHMICAGLSLTLAIAHAIVGIVWFFPW